MKKKIIAILSIVMVMATCLPAFASGFDLIPLYKDGDRTVEYFSFDWDAGGPGNNPWDGSSATVTKKHNREWVVTVSSQKNIRYKVGYAMGVPQSDTLYTDFVYRKGKGNFGGRFDGGASSYIGYNMCLVGEIDSREPSNSPQTSGQFSPDAAW